MEKNNHKRYKPGDSYYFVSDCHFGIPDRKKSLVRETKFVNWLEEIKADAKEVFIVGDLFDFWFEYKTVIPKGYARLFGKLAEITDMGIPVHFFRGNHDVWAFDYLSEELNIKIYREPLIRTLNGKKFYIAHGDGLGKGDNGYKFLKKVFEFPLNQWLFKWLHPDIGARMGLYFSGKSRLAHETNLNETEGMKRGINRLAEHCREVLKDHPDIDYFIFGHIHMQHKTSLEDKALYISLGDWLRAYNYAVFDGNSIELKSY